MGIGYSGAYSVPRLDLGEAFLEYMFSQADMIGLELMPVFESAMREATFSKILRESILRTVDLKRGANGNYNRDEFEAEDDSYRCDEYGHEVPLGDVERRRFRRDFDAEMQSAMHAWRRVLFGHELRVRNLVVDTVNFTVGNGRRTDVAIAWSAPQAGIIANARTAIDAIRARTGMEPNVWWIGYKTISHLIGRMMADLVETTEAGLREAAATTLEDVRRAGRRLVARSAEMEARNRELKAFLHERLYRHPKVEAMRFKAERFLTELFAAYVENPGLLDEEARRRADREGVVRVVCDVVAGMTDRTCLEEYRRLFDPFQKV